jgi:hypothetical protein
MKERYIQMRNEGKYDVYWFYEYYVEHSKHDIDFQTFSVILSNANLESIIDHIDGKYKLTRLYDDKNNFIKIID